MSGTPRLSRQRIVQGLAAAAVAAIVGSIVWAFGHQINQAFQMRAEEKRLEEAVAALQTQYDELCIELEHVQSLEYVEQWARTEANMARAGEIVVVMPGPDRLAPATSSAPPPVEGTEEIEASSFWARWWEAAFPTSSSPSPSPEPQK